MRNRKRQPHSRLRGAGPVRKCSDRSDSDPKNSQNRRRGFGPIREGNQVCDTICTWSRQDHFFCSVERNEGWQRMNQRRWLMDGTTALGRLRIGRAMLSMRTMHPNGFRTSASCWRESAQRWNCKRSQQQEDRKREWYATTHLVSAYDATGDSFDAKLCHGSNLLTHPDLRCFRACSA